MQFSQFLNQNQSPHIVINKQNISNGLLNNKFYKMEHDDYSLINVVRHLKYCIEHTQSDYKLALQYKYAKPTQPTAGNKKFQQILQKSHQHTMIMNANRQMKKKPYIHLKSMTYEDEFKWLQMNIKLLNKKHPIKIDKFHKIDLNLNGQKVSFQSQTMKWNYKTNRLLFRPNYEAVKNSKLFRISLVSQFRGNIQPKRRVVDMLQQALSKSVSEKEGQKNKLEGKPAQGSSCPLRFKQEMSFNLNKCCSIVTSRVFQVVNTKLYNQILQLVNNKKNSNDNVLGKVLLSDMVTQVFEQFEKDLSYESEFRFSSEFIQQFDDLHEQQIEQLMQKAGLIFTSMFRDPHDFTYEDIIDDLKSLESYW